MKDSLSMQQDVSQLSRYNQYLQLLLNLSSTLMNLPLSERDDTIQTALGDMAAFSRADRAYVFRYDLEQHTASNTHEWCGPGITPQIETLQHIPIASCAPFFEAHQQAQVFAVNDLSTTSDADLQRLLQAQGIQSLLTLPMMLGTECLGFVGFDSVHAPHQYSTQDLQLLQLFANLLSHLHQRQRMDTQLAYERSLLQTLVQTIPDLIWLVDSEGVFLACNHRFGQLYGADPQTIVGKRDEDFVTPELAAAFRAKDAQTLAVNGPLTYEELLTFASDGHQELTETTQTPMYANNGELMGVLGIGRNITERERIKQELKKQEHYHRAVLDNMPFLIWLKDERGRYLTVNKVFAQTCGVADPHEVMGKTDQEVWPTELAALYQAHDREVLASNHPSYVEQPIGTDRPKTPMVWYETFKSPVELDGQVRGTVGVSRDISERKAAEEHLALAASVFTHANEGIMITSPEGTLIEVNEAFSRITGYAREEVLGHNANIVSSGQESPVFYATMWETLIQKGCWSGEIWNRHKSGTLYLIHINISAVRNPQGHIVRYAGMFVDITEQKAHAKRLEHLAHFDALTGLPNRVLFTDRLRQSMLEAVQHGEKLALVFIDLDGFKAVNDTHGHSVGDKLLIALSDRMASTLREGDMLARLGGDEFVSVLNNIKSPTCAYPALERIRTSAAHTFLIDGLELKVSASLGVVFYPQDLEMDAEQLLRQADQAMYQAKLIGKNRYCVFDAAQEQQIQGLHEELHAIRQALQNQEFELHYQPKVHMQTGELVGCEALIRWRHPSKGLLYPADFLPLVQGNPLSIELGTWVLETALSQIEVWKQQWFPLPISVNVDGMHLQQAEFATSLKELLTAHPLVAPGDLELEILESSALDDIATVSSVMRACRELGVEFALDDFGTGYSSLTYLRRLPASQLKIDFSFVRDLLDDPNDMAILEGVLGLARAFRTQVIAEGVASLEHGAMLLLLGCEWGQGHAIAHAMPASDLMQWAREWEVPEAWKHLRPVDHHDLPLLSAMVAHRAWMKQLSEHLSHESVVGPELDSHTCHLGHWLADKSTQERYAARGEAHLNELMALHERIHATAHQLLEWKRQGLTAPLQTGLATLITMRDELLASLMKLLH